MTHEIVLTDPLYVKPARHGPLDRFLLRFIVDERDLPFLYLMLRMAILIVPTAIYSYLPGRFSWWIALPYLAFVYGMNAGPFIAVLHYSCHRRLFARKYEWMNKIIPWALGPFFGETPETYFGHHLGMHHPENNLDDDLSSTMRYRRDSFPQFLVYFLRFFLLVVPELSSYLARKGRTKIMRMALLGEFSWYLTVIVLAWFNLEATLVVFILPFVVTRFMMMAGNWGQHAFVDPEQPENCYRNAIICINVRYNHACLNDGYHIIHHLHPAMHYTDMPGEFLATRETCARQKAIVFDGLDFFMVWFLLMVKAYRTLARRVVRLDDSPCTEDEIVALLKSRTMPIPASASLAPVTVNAAT